MSKSLFIAKTNLNNDGRILNEIALLKDIFNDLRIDFILLPDKPTTIELDEIVTLHEINPSLRHNKWLRFFTVIEFTWRSVRMMLKFNPELVHVQDSAVLLPALIFSFLRPQVRMVYDDHEIPNENANFPNKIFTKLEVLLMKRADYVIHANEERMDVINERHNISTPSTYFLNLPYFEDASVSPNSEDLALMKSIDHEIEKGTKFIMHQGVIVKERGSNALAKFSEKLPVGFKLLLLGGNREGFDSFIQQTGAKPEKFKFIGSVNYTVLPLFWDRVVASVVMYLPTYINNRLCAPNRFYLSIQKGIPVIVNKGNPVLNNFIEKYKCGFFIEEVTEQWSFEDVLQFDSKKLDFSYSSIRTQQINQLGKTYVD